MPVEIPKDIEGRVVECVSGLAHGTAKHTDRIGDIRPGVRGAVEQGAHQGLVTSEEPGIDGLDRLTHRVDDLILDLTVGGGGDLVATEGDGDTVGKMFGHQAVDVSRLAEHDLRPLA